MTIRLGNPRPAGAGRDIAVVGGHRPAARPSGWPVKSDVIVIDIAMPLLNGLEATLTRSSEARGEILILSTHGDARDQAIRLGAADTAQADLGPHSLEAIRECTGGSNLAPPSRRGWPSGGRVRSKPQPRPARN